MHRGFRLVWVACLTLPFAAASLAVSELARAVPIVEETLSPGTNSVSYTPCSSLDLSNFTASVSDESRDCALKVSYKWADAALPTTAERTDLCTCKTLIRKFQEVKIPRCSLIKDEREMSYAKLVQYAFGLCSPNGGTAAPVVSNLTTAPTITTPAPTTRNTVPVTFPSPTTSSFPTPTTPSPTRARDTSTTDKTNTATSNESDSNSNSGVIIAIVGGSVVVVAIAILVAFKCGQRRRAATTKNDPHDLGDQEVMNLSPVGAYHAITPSNPSVGTTVKTVTRAESTPHTTNSSSTGDRSSSTTNPGQRTTRPTEMAMWDDPVLLAVRVPYDTVFFGPLLSRGGYGEVYKGTYRGETVAIKLLLPERRKNLAEIDNFLSEVKLMSTLEHERIVRFIGVAWNALSDACAITEYMENGDLRSVLTRWNDHDGRPEGFDADKVRIALHVAHALTYLHSLDPVVVHRDLKSKNILLDASYDAKLTDFGVSRERADSTMTPAVGTSLWMAPEVMLGERYDEKADIFSFGIVLSELDSQKLPYAHAKDTTTAGHKLPDSAILQMVSLGRLQVNFSTNAHPDLVLLGRDCVQLDAKKRPTAAAVLHRVHQVLRSSF